MSARSSSKTAMSYLSGSSGLPQGDLSATSSAEAKKFVDKIGSHVGKVSKLNDGAVGYGMATVFVDHPLCADVKRKPLCGFRACLFNFGQRDVVARQRHRVEEGHDGRHVSVIIRLFIAAFLLRCQDDLVLQEAAYGEDVHADGLACGRELVDGHRGRHRLLHLVGKLQGLSVVTVCVFTNTVWETDRVSLVNLIQYCIVLCHRSRIV